MSDETFPKWPLRPSQSATVTYQLCMAMADVIHHEGSAGMEYRTYLKLCGLATALELFAGETAHWFTSRMGEDGERLEALEGKGKGSDE